MQSALERIERLPVAEGVDGDARRIVPHPSADAGLDGHAVHPRAKADTLDGAPDPNAFSLRSGSHDSWN